MAGGFAGALSLVPWGMLIEKAPQIAENAARLVAKVRRENDAATADPSLGATERIAQLEAAQAALEGQLAVASQLIKDLADEGRALAALHRQQLAWTRGAAGLAVAALVVAGIALLV